MAKEEEVFTIEAEGDWPHDTLCIPSLILDIDLSAKAIVFYLRLYKEYVNTGKILYRTTERISMEFHMNKNTVTKIKQELVNNNIIKIRTHKAKLYSKDKDGNQYQYGGQNGHTIILVDPKEWKDLWGNVYYQVILKNRMIQKIKKYLK